MSQHGSVIALAVPAVIFIAVWQLKMDYCQRMLARALGLVLMFMAGAVPAAIVVGLGPEIMCKVAGATYWNTEFWTWAAAIFCGGWHLCHNLPGLVEIMERRR